MQRTDEAGKDASKADALPPMFSDAQMRKLKAAVIGMGVLLLAGFALVIGRIVYLLNRPPVDAVSDGRAALPATATPGGPAQLLPQAQLALPDGAVIRQISLSGNRVAVHYEAPSGQGIQIFDLVLGRPVQRIDVVPHKASR